MPVVHCKQQTHTFVPLKGRIGMRQDAGHSAFEIQVSEQLNRIEALLTALLAAQPQASMEVQPQTPVAARPHRANAAAAAAAAMPIGSAAPQGLAAAPGETPPAQPAALPVGMEAALLHAAKATAWLNACWQPDADQRDVLDAIRRRIATDPDARVLGFRDHVRALADSSYAEFAPDSDGRLFVLRCGQLAGGDALFAAFPYPVNDIWYDRGVTMLERLYNIHGARDFLSPCVQVGEAALLRATAVPGSMETIYLPMRVGTMQVA